MLNLGKNVSMPENAITETFGILAARGAGKSNTAAVMAEEMFAAGLPFVVIDPIGSWWGLRSSAKGSGAGLPIALFGGRRGDVPLERTGGKLVADLVVDQRLSCVLDLTQFESEAAKKQFLLDFARRLYTRNEAPLHLFLEEADDYIPQRPMRDEAQLLRAWENIVRRGRARGLGMTMITQRSASLNKNVLTQVQTLIAMRTTGPQDRKAIEEWIKYNDQSKDILETLAGLANGEAWLWSPQFLGVTERVQFRRRRTFDSGSTPTMAAKSKTATLADVDVSALRSQMADTIKRAEEEDPKALRRRIAELEKELKTQAKADPGEYMELRTKIFELGQQNRQLRDRGDQAVQQLVAADATFQKIGELLRDTKFKTPADPPPPVKVQTSVHRPASTATKSRVNGSTPTPPAANSNSTLGKGEKKVLTAIAQHADGVDRVQLSVLTGYKASSRNTYIQRLSSAGLVDVAGETITATSAGVAALGADFEPLPTGTALREYWLAKLTGGEQLVLSELINAHPAGLSREEISDRTHYKPSSRNTYIQRLSQRKLVDVRSDRVLASTNLFN